MWIRSVIPECPKLDYTVTIHLTRIDSISFCWDLWSQVPLTSNTCWCSVFLMVLALNMLLVRALAQDREVLCIYSEVSHLNGEADSCKKQKDSWKESCKQGILSGSQMPYSWPPSSSLFLIYCLSPSVRAVFEHSPLALRIKHSQCEKVSWEDSWECNPSQTRRRMWPSCSLHK